MRDELKEIFIRGCNEKIEKKGENVGLSFYAFFKNKNDIILYKVLLKTRMQ